MTYHTTTEAAAAARVHVTTLYRAMNAGLLHTTKLGGRRLVSEADLDAWLRGDRVAA